MRDVPWNRYILFALIAVAGFVGDQLTKAWVFSWPELRAGEIFWLWPGHAGFQLSWNQGALFGMGQGNVWLFAALSFLAGIAIPLWLFRCHAAQSRWLTVTLGLVMGGLLGNLYDRLGLPDHLWPGRKGDLNTPIHAVRDWILVQWNDQVRWPNFNVADSLLVAGAIALVVHAILHPNTTDEAPEAARDVDPSG